MRDEDQSISNRNLVILDRGKLGLRTGGFLRTLILEVLGSTTLVSTAFGRTGHYYLTLNM